MRLPRMRAAGVWRGACVLVSVALLAGCVTSGTTSRKSGVGGSAASRSIVAAELDKGAQKKDGYLLRGVSWTPVDSLFFPAGPASSALVDKYIGQHSKAALTAAGAGDVELAAVHYRLGAEVARVKLQSQASMLHFLVELLARKTGESELLAQAAIFLPMRPAEDAMLSVSPSALEGSLLQPGKTYVVTTDEGQQFIAARSSDGLTLINQQNVPVRVDLAKLGAVPRLKPLTADQARLGILVARIEQSLRQAYDAEVSKGPVSSAGTVAPNTMMLGTQRGSAFYSLDSEGHITQKETLSGARSYDKDSTYRLAVDLTSLTNLRQDPVMNEFVKKCSPMAARLRHGAAAEYVTYYCSNNYRDRTYERTFLLEAGQPPRDWKTMLQDPVLRKKYASMAMNAERMEAALSFLPLYGQVDSGVECVDGISFTKKFLMSQGSKDDKQAFVFNAPDNMLSSGAERALTCASLLFQGKPMQPKAKVALQSPAFAQANRSIDAALAAIRKSPAAPEVPSLKSTVAQAAWEAGKAGFAAREKAQLIEKLHLDE